MSEIFNPLFNIHHTWNGFEYMTESDMQATTAVNALLVATMALIGLVIVAAITKSIIRTAKEPSNKLVTTNMSETVVVGTSLHDPSIAPSAA